MDTQSIKPFKPALLQDLVNFLYVDEHESVREFKVKEILSNDNNKGTFWENVLAKAMHHTTLLERNAWYMDFDDGTDAKFAQAGYYTKGPLVASINIENKTGTLRVCLCVKGGVHHKVYFMLIPYSYYSKLNPKSPIKVTISNFSPCGKIWDQFRCSWEEVIQPITKVDTIQEIVYTDEYQLLLEHA